MKIWRSSFSLGFVLITLLIIVSALYVNDIPRQQARQGQWVNHTHEVLGQFEALIANIIKVRSAHNDYQLTHSKADYDEYRTAIAQVDTTVNAIKRLTADNPRQQSLIAQLVQQIEGKVADLKHDMDPALMKPGGTRYDKIEMDTIIKSIDAMRDNERQLLAQRLSNWENAVKTSRMYFLGAFAVLYIFMLFAYISSRRQAAAREKLLAIENQNSAMHASLASRMVQIVGVLQEIVYERLNLDNTMKIITERTMEIAHADGAVVEMLEGEEVVYRAGAGTMQPFVGFRMKVEGSLSGLCISTGVIQHCVDSEADDRVDRGACRKVGLRSMIVVPLIADRHTVGVLKVTHAQPKHFTLEDESALQLMAGVLSSTLRDARILAQLRDSHESLSQTNMELATQAVQLLSEKNELAMRADTDGMTGLKNYRYFEEHFLLECQRATRYGNALSLILIDVDHFKLYNDKFGHPEGDAVLRSVAKLLGSNARPMDCVARYGGEEFVLYLPQTDADGASVIAERIRIAIERVDWKLRAVTISVGVSSNATASGDAALMIKQADKALYKSKAGGRNRVSLYSEQLES